VGLFEAVLRFCRNMPKRPCAITFSPDGQTIFSADKFGDVYALPLLPSMEEDETAREAAKKASKQWIPAATELTVHSKANLRSLQNQMKQAQENPPVKTKEPLEFAHSLILGHVSMLTDIVIASSSTNGSRQFVITADRDEHIRVSRWIPQSYVIKGFCLGHKEFVNKLCLVPGDILLSAGGDDEVYVWEWLNMRLITKINISDAVSKIMNKIVESEEPLQIAITGLWHVPSYFKAVSQFSHR
jgi:tRNA (guanine-N(7)-)-methyltransferase subunit TRM82